eukprot:364506-Chlamydomonas_euryale.AAC.6
MHVDACARVYAYICYSVNPVYAVCMRGLFSRLPARETSASAGPQPRECMHVNAPRPPASGIYVHTCPRSQPGLGLGRRDGPRPAASAHVLSMDHPASLSH